MEGDDVEDDEVEDDDVEDDDVNGEEEDRPLGAHFARACAAEMHVNISQEPLYTEIYRKKARDQSEHPDQAPTFTATLRTPQCGHTVWGIFDTTQQMGVGEDVGNV